MSTEEYKRNNLLKVEVRSKDVAELVAAMAGPLFSRTTGAQIAVDGGSDRII
jgi:enoyl-[acyl-carrier-protein] reductase (NADH)